MKDVVFSIAIIACWVACVVGYIINIVALFSYEPWVWSGQTIIGIVGIFVAPLGSIMGLFIW